MGSGTAEMVVVIPRCWRVQNISEGNVVFTDTDGEGVPRSMSLSVITDGALRQLKQICLGKIHNLVMDRAGICKHIEEINGELDRRKNDNACAPDGKGLPQTPSRGGQGMTASGGQL